MSAYKQGDRVLIRGDVVEHIEGVGVKVEVFSKTDQYRAWVREDLVTSGIVLDPSGSPEPLTAVAASVLLDASAEIVEKKVKRPVREVALLRWIADQIEEQSKPPKPDEPTGLGAVVEDSEHRLWIRHSNTPGSFPWICEGRGVEGWSQVDAVKVLSQGVER